MQIKAGALTPADFHKPMVLRAALGYPQQQPLRFVAAEVGEVPSMTDGL
mgnify:CR=1 FL=1